LHDVLNKVEKENRIFGLSEDQLPQK